MLSHTDLITRCLLLDPFIFYFFFNDTATTEIYTLSLHDALPIFDEDLHGVEETTPRDGASLVDDVEHLPARTREAVFTEDRKSTRLNSSHSQISYAVFCLKKKKNTSRIAEQDATSEEYCPLP